MFKQLFVAAILAAPCAAFAGQAMSIDDGFAVASNASTDINTVMAPMQDGGAADVRAPGSGRGVDADTHTSESAPARGAHAPRAATTGEAAAVGATHAHKAHGKTPWQSLLPGVMK